MSVGYVIKTVSYWEWKKMKEILGAGNRTPDSFSNSLKFNYRFLGNPFWIVSGTMDALIISIHY